MADDLDDELLEHDPEIPDDVDHLGTDREDDEDDAPATGQVDDDQLDVFLGDDEPSDEVSTIRHMREQLKAVSRERDDLRSKVPAAPAIEVGDRPTLEACDYDEDRHAEAVEQWVQRKATAETQQADARRQQEAAQAEVQKDIDRLTAAEKALKVPDYAEKRDIVVSSLSDGQQLVLAMAADNGAQVVYVLGRNPKRLDEIKKITNPVKLAVAINNLEKEIKVQKRSARTEPEERVRGSASLTGGADKQLEKLEAEADRTGDRTKIRQYRQSQKEKKSA